MLTNWTKIVAGSVLLAASVVAALPVALSFGFCATALIVTGSIDEMERR